MLLINDMVLCTFGSKSDHDDDDDDDDNDVDPQQSYWHVLLYNYVLTCIAKWKVVRWKLLLKAGLFSYQRQIIIFKMYM